MTIDYGPFDSGVGADRQEDFWRAFFRHVTGSGVIDGERSEFAVSERGAGANMSVDVAAGTAFVRGHWIDSDATENVAISDGDGSNDRIDRVVLRADFSANTISVEVLEGTPAASPSAPTLTQTSSRWEISLAQILVATGESTSIVNGDITDERTILGFPGFDFGTAPTADQQFKYDTSTGLLVPTDSASSVSPLWVPVGAFVSLVGSPVLSGMATNTTPLWLLDSSSTEIIGSNIATPSGWTTFHVDLYWANPGAGSGDCHLDVYLNTYSDGSPLPGGATVSNGQALTAPPGDNLKVSRIHTGATAGGAMNVRVVRSGGNGADTLGNDMGVIGLLLTKAS